MRWMFVVAALAGCGRVGFESRLASDAQLEGDVLPRAQPCGGRATAPDPVGITGVTYRYTSFANTRAPIASVTVTALDDHNATIGTPTTSDTNGNYTLVVPTGGVARAIKVHYTDSGDFATTVHFDAPIDRPIGATNTSWFSLGDGPLWAQGSMDSVYGAAGETRDPAKGTISIEAYDCADMPLDGVALTVTPAPELLAFTAASGQSDTSLTATTLPYTLAVGYNAIPGPTHFTAAKPGVTFVEQDVDVLGGANDAIVVFRPVQ